MKGLKIFALAILRLSLGKGRRRCLQIPCEVIPGGGSDIKTGYKVPVRTLHTFENERKLENDSLQALLKSVVKV